MNFERSKTFLCGVDRISLPPTLVIVFPTTSITTSSLGSEIPSSRVPQIIAEVSDGEGLEYLHRAEYIIASSNTLLPPQFVRSTAVMFQYGGMVASVAFGGLTVYLAFTKSQLSYTVEDAKYMEEQVI